MKKTPPRSRGLREERAERSTLSRRFLLPAQDYVYSETISGALLLVFAGIALVWANSAFSQSYFALLDLPISIRLGEFTIEEDLKHWVNDGLMAIFFFVVALEIKRELLHGELAGFRKAALPAAAALGGMVVPVGIFLAFNVGGAVRGWGIPMATDIAFALAVLALLGNRVPAQLRLFLLSYAIVDDLGSILVIAVYYTQHFSLTALLVAGGTLLVILGMRWAGFATPVLYLLPALVFWTAMLQSGVHATIAGVILGALTPARPRADHDTLVSRVEHLLPDVQDALDKPDEEREARLGQLEELVRQTESPLERLERLVHPWVSYFVLPIFALANAGMEISMEILGKAAVSPVTQGVFWGLLVGKAIGTSGLAWLAVKMGLAKMPDGVQWRHLIGAGILGGVGFTVSLFITNLAYAENDQVSAAKIAILAASVLAAVTGYGFLRVACRPGGKTEPQE